MRAVPRDPRRLAAGLMRRFGATTQVRFSYPLKVGHQWFRIPVIDGVGADHVAPYERWFGPVLALLMRATPGALFVDIGANVGQTLLRVKGEYPDVPYVAFEPNPHCVHYLHELIRQNPTLRDVVLYPVGLADRVQMIPLIVEYGTDGQGTVVPDFRSADETKQRIMVALVDIGRIEQFTAEKYIFKIDVEGAELEVLMGLESILEQRRPPLICEVLPAYTSTHPVRVERQARLEQALRAWRYVAVRIPLRDRPSVVTEFGIHSNLDWTNYVLVPSENQALLSALLSLDLRSPERH
jgi:FkbM family methyltransferase